MKTTNNVESSSKGLNNASKRGSTPSAKLPWQARIGGTHLGRRFSFAAVLLTLTALFVVGVGGAWARPMSAVAPPMGTAGDFAVLAGSTATNTGPTTIIGDLGVSPGNAVVGFPPGLITDGTIHAANGVAMQAQSDVTTAYNNLAGQACDRDLTDQDLGNLILTPGVYCFSTSAQLTGMLTLDGQGDPDAIFVFQTGSTLTTASNSSVLAINGAAACNVYWQIGSSATVGTGTSLVGSVLALTSITLNTDASLFGRALARGGAVTMDSNSISTSSCDVASPTNTPDPSVDPTTPVATPVGPGTILTPIATNPPGGPGNTATPIATIPPGGPGAGNTPTPIATNPPGGPGAGNTPTPVSPGGAGTPAPPTSLEPIGQPVAGPFTLYLPFEAK